MLRKLCAALAVTAATATLFTISTSPASASNGNTGPCISLFVEYTSEDQNIKHVSYVEARNTCATYFGHFNISGAIRPNPDADLATNQPFRQNVDHTFSTEKAVPRFCATGYERNGGGHINRGSVCVDVV